MRWILCLGVAALLTGCDASKDELQSTKATLVSVTKERDDLKTQLATVQQELTTTKAELVKATAPPPASAKTATTDAKPEAKSKAHKS